MLDLGGNLYCGSCKVLALGGRTPMLEAMTQPCADAGTAMNLAVMSFFCFGIVLGPMAIIKGLGARNEIAANPRLTGWGKANAAVVLALIGLVLTVMNYTMKHR